MSVRPEETIRIFNIQRYSVHDGNGIRTNIFLKGCPLKCKWCSNPESQSFSIESTFSKRSCMSCMGCVQLCPEGALLKNGEKDKDKCVKCFKCEEVCPTASWKIIGKDWTIDDVVDEVLKDYSFFKSSTGGVTISGGEPLSQPKQAAKLVAALKKVGLHLAIETCGYAKWVDAEPVLSNVDQILYDIKEMDSVKHKEFTGVDNRLILENARKAASLDNEFIVRVPVIGGYNNSKKNIRGIAEFAAKIGADEINLLPYHRFGENKYEKSQMEYECNGYTPDGKEMAEFVEIVKSCGVRVKIGG